MVIKRLIISEMILEQMKKGKGGYLFGYIHTKEGVVHVVEISKKKNGSAGYKRIGSWGYDVNKANYVFFSPTTMEAFFINNGIQTQLEIDVIRFKTDIFARVKGIFDADTLSTKTVAIIGCGSGGSLLSLELAKAGLGRFILIDSDDFSVNNICRHVGDMDDMGRYKTYVVRDKIHRRNPLAEVMSVEDDILRIERNKIMEILSPCDLLIASTDSREANFYLNELSLELGIPLVWIGFYERASWGHVVYSIPEKTPCLACVVPSISDIVQIAPKEERIIDYSAVDDVTKIKAEPGLGVDVAFVTIAGAKIALAILLRDLESSSFSKFLDFERTMLIVANVPGAIFPDTKPLSTSWVKTKIREDCDYCQKDWYLKKYGMSETELRNSVKNMVDEIPLIDDPLIQERED